MHGTLYQSGFEETSFKLLEIYNLSNSGEIRLMQHLATKEHGLRSGDLLRVFNSIDDGEKILTETINFKTDPKYHQTYPREIDRALWCSLFSMRLPARLTKADGSVHDGVLDPFTEQGMEGFVAWSVYDFHNQSYGSLHTMEDGDTLTVFSKVTKGNVLWEGRIELADAPEHTGQKIMRVSLKEGSSNLMDLDIREGTETMAQTYITPSAAQLKEWSIRNLPAQILH